MKKNSLLPYYSSKLILAIGMFLGISSNAFAQTTTFSYTGAVQFFTVPAGCSAVGVDLSGGKGGGSLYLNGGAAGRVQCNLAVTGGQVLSVYVGNVGAGTGSPGGGNGSGYFGGNGTSNGGAGGGCTEIQYGGTRLVVAGGGGGGSWDCTTDHGGLGGGLVGSNGLQCGSYNSTYCGAGGTQLGGGIAASNGAGCTAGSFGNGGNANTSGTLWASGGGAGYYGGGGGSYYGSGGGGSSYTDPVLATSVVHTQGYNNVGNGSASITPLIPTAIPSTSGLAFGPVVVGSVSATQVFSVTANTLTPPSGNLTITAPAGFLVSSTGTAGTFASTASVGPYAAGILTLTPVYVRFAPGAYAAYSANITISGGGIFTPVPVNVTGTGVFPCSGTPSPAAATVSPTSGGSGTTFVLSVPPITSTGGITYQWQTYNLTTGSFFTNIAGATTATYNLTTGIASDSYFRCVVSCPSGGSAFTNIVLATLSPAGTPCSGLPSPGIISGDVVTGCAPSYVSNLYYSSTDASSGYTYQWQSSSTSSTTGFTNIAGATLPYYSATVTATKWYQLKVTCGIGGSFTAPQQLTFNSLPTPITGLTNLCIGQPSALGSTPTGGTWSSSNNSIASVALGTGAIVAVSPGVANITYTAPSGCIATTTVSANISPSNIVGAINVCAASTTSLSDPTPGGTWSSSSFALATVSSSGVVTGVAAGAPVISYILPNGCAATTAINVNANPAPITGSNNVCIGSTNTLLDITPGGSWVSSNSFQAAVNSATGVVTGVAAGSPVLKYVLSTGCGSVMPYTVNVLPSAIVGPTSVCVGSTISLSDPSGAGDWSSSNTSIASVGATSAILTGVAAGTATATFTLSTTGCRATSAITVNPKPVSYNVTGGGGYCSGTTTGVHIGLNGSQNTVNYQLYLAGTGPVGSPVAGSSSGLDFGLYTAVGTYSVQGTSATTGCVSSMAGTSVVNINALPNVYTVSGGGAYCAGGTGMHVTLTGSDLGVMYQLWNGSTMVGSPVAGTGTILDLGAQTMVGTYTVSAINSSTLCTASMTGSTSIIINPLPAVYPVGGGGGYCVGGTGVAVTLPLSTAGTDYQLYRGGILVPGAVVSGSGGSVSFPLQTVPGVYTVGAHDIANSCNNTMSGSTTIFINPLPAVYNVTGGGAYCSGGTGVHVGMNFGVLGTTYELFNGFVTTGITMLGANSGFDFGLQTAPGNYTVVGTINATGCTSNMSGSVNVTVNTLPLLFSVTGGGSYCAGGNGVPVMLNASELGMSYRLYLGTTPVGPAMTGTGGTVNFGLQTGAGVYTIVATNLTTLCSRTMTGSVTVSINPLPAVYNVSGGGNYCAGGAGMHVMLNNSTAGINYTLSLGTSAVTSMTSTGGAMDFGAQTGAGIYTAMARNTVTGCTVNMSGSAVIGILPAPAAYGVTGGGAYCSGGTGVHVGLAVSNSGITYQLSNGSGPVAALAGTGSSLDFGTQTAAGIYTIMATNNTTSCTNNMTGSATVVINPLPVSFTVGGGGTICAGAAGVPVTLSGSATGIAYQLFNGTTALGSPVSGTGSTINYGLRTVAGSYTVIATDMATTCTRGMAGSAVINVNAVPTVYNVSGGGSYCASSTVGVHINLSGSDLGVRYQIWNAAGMPEGTFWAGTSRSLDMGAHTAAGTFKVTATDATTGCASNMNDSAIITIIPTVTPAVSIATSSPMGDTICSASMTMFTANPVNGGSAPVYQWKVNGVNTGTGSSYSYVPADNDNVSVTLTSNAVCPWPASATDLHTISVAVPQTPAVTVTANPGASVCPGVMVTYSAAPAYGGTAPLYTWKKNGSVVGTTNTFQYVPADGDVVYCTMNSNYFCQTSSLSLSNDLVMQVNTPQLPTFTIQTDPGTTVVSSHSVTFIAAVDNAAATAPTYQWKVNGAAIPRATSPTYTASDLSNNDVVCAVVIGHNTCGASDPATQCETMDVTSNLGVNTTAVASDVKVMPNPNKGTFAVKGTVGISDGEVTLEVTNMLGQVVYTSKIAAHNGSIDEQVHLANGLANGMYLLNVRTATENSVFHFVVEQ